MGCMGAQPQGSRRNLDIQNQIKKMGFQIDMKTKRIRQQAQKQQTILVGEFKKPRPNRAAAAEKSISEQIVIMINNIHIYEVIKAQLDKINVYANHLEDPAKARQTLFPSFRIIIYAQEIIKDNEISMLVKKIKKKFSKYGQQLTPKESQITSEIMIHHKKTYQPSYSMVNNYILSLCSQQNMSLQQINSVGHSFRFGG